MRNIKPEDKTPFNCPNTGKRGYHNRKQAAEAKRECERKYPYRFTLYKCDKCIGYHLTKLINGIKHRNRKNEPKNRT